MTTKRLLLLSGGAVILAAVSSPHIIPLYDGVGFPDEPYRYVEKTGTPAATGLSQTINIGDLNQYGAAASSQESGPQISIYFQQNSVKLPDNASLTIRATPAAPTVQPSPGSIAGNVYNVQATSKSGTPRFDSSKSAIFMRLPSDKPMYKIAIVYRSGDSAQWRTQFTTKTGNDIFKTDFLGSGQYALAYGLDMPSKPGPHSGSGGNAWLQSFLRYAPWILFVGIILTAILIARFKKPNSQHHHHD